MHTAILDIQIYRQICVTSQSGKSFSACVLLNTELYLNAVDSSGFT